MKKILIINMVALSLLVLVLNILVNNDTPGNEFIHKNKERPSGKFESPNLNQAREEKRFTYNNNLNLDKRDSEDYLPYPIDQDFDEDKPSSLSESEKIQSSNMNSNLASIKPVKLKAIEKMDKSVKETFGIDMGAKRDEIRNKMRKVKDKELKDMLEDQGMEPEMIRQFLALRDKMREQRK